MVNEMGPQEIFDTVVRGIFEQGGPSRDHTFGSPAYRDCDGRKCAVGQIIVDEHYDPCIEGCRLPAGGLEHFPFKGNTLRRVKALVNAIEASGISSDDFPLVSVLQRGHDDSHRAYDMMFLEQFTSHAVRIAEYYDLNTDVLDALREAT